jgi:hypothetical protein
MLGDGGEVGVGADTRVPMQRCVLPYGTLPDTDSLIKKNTHTKTTPHHGGPSCRSAIARIMSWLIICKLTQIDRQAGPQTDTHTHTHVRARTNTPIHTHTQTHQYAHTHTHTHTHTHRIPTTNNTRTLTLTNIRAHTNCITHLRN